MHSLRDIKCMNMRVQSVNMQFSEQLGKSQRTGKKHMRAESGGHWGAHHGPRPSRWRGLGRQIQLGRGEAGPGMCSRGTWCGDGSTRGRAALDADLQRRCSGYDGREVQQKGSSDGEEVNARPAGTWHGPGRRRRTWRVLRRGRRGLRRGRPRTGRSRQTRGGGATSLAD